MKSILNKQAFVASFVAVSTAFILVEIVGNILAVIF
jgi:hypothetical protein